MAGKSISEWLDAFVTNLRSLLKREEKGVLLEVKQKDEYEQCLDLLNNLIVPEFGKYKPYHATGLVLTSYFDNLIDLAEEIRGVVAFIEIDRSVNMAFMCKYSRVHELGKFITEKDGKYIKATQSVAAFKKHSINLCLILKESQQKEQTGNMKFNARVVKPLLKIIVEMTEQLQLLTMRF